MEFHSIRNLYLSFLSLLPIYESVKRSNIISLFLLKLFLALFSFMTIILLHKLHLLSKYLVIQLLPIEPQYPGTKAKPFYVAFFPSFRKSPE